MRIKRLEIQGFKSFKDKTIVHFDHGITGIVGPNGCGKSNIVDAFFWVMGEQSYKHMRGNSSDDLIFNGSSKYSPLGLAEATLVMETDVADTDSLPSGADAPAGATARDIPVHLKHKEISVTRRLYRTGEGEYFINGIPARLKDIHELFMDTGVGAKGYSVIEQGQIGKIVNAKPEERRLLIEEAAGIAKYKARKKESLRKMEATQANLARLNDVVAEIERNLSSLERQAQKARLYRKYKDELLDKELTWGRRKIQVIRQRLELLKTQRDTFEQELLILRTELQTTENNLEADRTHQLTDTKEAEELQSVAQNMADELARERSLLELSRRRRGDLASQLATLQHERSDLAASTEEEVQRLLEREESASESDAAFQAASDRATVMGEEARDLRRETDEIRREVEKAKRALMEAISRNSNLTSKAASLGSHLESAQQRMARLDQQATQQQERVDATAVEETQARETTAQLRTRREDLLVQVQLGKTALSTADTAARAQAAARDVRQRELTQVRSKLSSLEELDRAHEGFGDGPKAVLEFAQSLSRGTDLVALADAFKVGTEFESALGGWLENRLEHLVSSDPKLALGALDQIRDEHQGRVAIHLSKETPAETTPNYEEIVRALTGAGFDVRGELSSVVQVDGFIDAKLVEVASRMISRVAVVASLAPLPVLLGSNAIRELNGWSLVSLDGSVFHGEGMLAGGSQENNAGTAMLKRKRSITELQAQAIEAEAIFATAEAAVVEAQAASDAARANLQSAQSDLQAVEIQAAALERDVHQTARAVREARNQLELTAEERAEVERELENSREERVRVEEAMSGFETERAAMEESAQVGEAGFQEKDSALRTKESELQVLRVNEAELRERANSLRRELETGRALVADRKRRMAEIDRTLERATQEQEQFVGGATDLESKIEELTRAVGEAREKLSAAKDRVEQSTAKINHALDRIKELHKTGDAKNSEANQVALEVEKLAGEDAHLIQNLEEKYGPGCLERPVTSSIQEEMTEPVITAEMSAEEELELGEEVERLRERIRRLGEVNVMAIEEFEDTKRRHDHILQEKADLEHSIDNLNEAIEHINKTSEERFTKAFEAIADRFERLFPIIFGGGEAKLSLVYPEGSQDVLDAGVDILARPPGKKIQNMTLLSGGEKALTAVSLIFAIFMVKPSPFCILDEVDAPLDDANVGKFNALLREMSAKSQFILITHNKKTMELNDTLYGVTMEEPGVSKMVSIEMH